MTPNPIPILLSAGEASGDMYAARLATALQQRLNVKIFGLGGDQMRAAGVDIIADYHEVSVVGITEILSHLPSLIRAMRKLVAAARQRKPALAILTDFPGFHLRLARKLLPLGVRNVYYICPQFWAWRPWRANLVRRRFVQALCIFPFEEDFFRERSVNAKFIGHPLVGTVQPTLSREQFAAKHNLDPRNPIITLLPGSRWGEISRHFPTMLESCRELERLAPAAYNFVLAVAPGIDLARLRTLIAPDRHPTIVQNETYNALASADAALVCSGTATVEAALLDTPMAVVYRVTPITALLAKPLVRTKFFSMVNLIAGRAVVPELIQGDFTAPRAAAELRRLLDPAFSSELRRGLAEVRARLGPPGAIDRAADAIAALLQRAAH
ncbi:MAG TPA: lipid-A-disaccharide synthase [Candidatus Dormibacteraeota bacterium]|nr:lipid-A-disaccharide synthase [Candidatus Dormibacteraeota bacterium]